MMIHYWWTMLDKNGHPPSCLLLEIGPQYDDVQEQTLQPTMFDSDGLDPLGTPRVTTMMGVAIVNGKQQATWGYTSWSLRNIHWSQSVMVVSPLCPYHSRFWLATGQAFTPLMNEAILSVISTRVSNRHWYDVRYQIYGCDISAIWTMLNHQSQCHKISWLPSQPFPSSQS